MMLKKILLLLFLALVLLLTLRLLLGIKVLNQAIIHNDIWRSCRNGNDCVLVYRNNCDCHYYKCRDYSLNKKWFNLYYFISEFEFKCETFCKAYLIPCEVEETAVCRQNLCQREVRDKGVDSR